MKTMKNIKFIYAKITPILGLILILNSGCERDLSDEVEFATLDKSGEVFIDDLQIVE